MTQVIGIDFGAAYCRTALASAGNAETFPNHFSERRLPLAVEFVSAAQPSEGGAGPASLQFRSIKQQIGLDASTLQFDGTATAPAAAAELFRSLREDARERAGQDVVRAVLAVPAFYPERKRSALRKASEQAGFERVHLLDETLAVLLAVKLPPAAQRVLVFSMGAGICAASLVRMIGGVPQALCHEGAGELGGDDFDADIVAFILAELGLTQNDFKLGEESVRKLRAVAEQVKIGLSKRTEEAFDVHAQELFSDAAAAKLERRSAAMSLSRERFEGMIADETEQALAVARRAVGGTPPPDGQSPDGLAIDHVVLVGGSTRVPLIERRLRELFPVDFTRAPEDAIARGAALHGAQLGADDWQKREDVVESVAPPLEREPRRPRAAPRPAELRAAASGWVAMFSPALAGAESLWQSGQQAEAIAEMERALEEMRKYIGFLCFQLSAQAHRAAAQTIDDGNFNEAAPYIDQAIAAAEKGQQYGNTNKDAVAIHHHSLNLKGHLLLAAGKLEEAHSVVQKAIRMVPRCAGCEQLRERIEQAMRQGRTAPGTPGWRRKRRR